MTAGPAPMPPAPAAPSPAGMPDDVASAAARAVPGAHAPATCPNCGAPLHGRYCSDCGQLVDDHHRSATHWLMEAVEALTHADGRLARTLPALLFHPGQLARDHMEGRRQRHVPPFRLFMVTLLLFMLSAEFAVDRGGNAPQPLPAVAGHQSFTIGSQKFVVARSMQDAIDLSARADARSSRYDRWMLSHLTRASANRAYYLMLVFDWAHRSAILMLPILAVLLTLCYLHRRIFFAYDHLMVAMQYLSFCFLVITPLMLLPDRVAAPFWVLALTWTLANLYQLLRTVYRSRPLGAMVKTAILWSFTIAAFFVLLMGLLAYTLNEM